MQYKNSSVLPHPKRCVLPHLVRDIPVADPRCQSIALYTHTCSYIYTHTCSYIYIYVYTYRYVYVYTYIHIQWQINAVSLQPYFLFNFKDIYGSV